VQPALFNRKGVSAQASQFFKHAINTLKAILRHLIGCNPNDYKE
jgi:hypothetical protein